MKKVLVDLTFIHSEKKMKESVAHYAITFLKNVPEELRPSIYLLVHEQTKEQIISKIGEYNTIIYHDLPTFILKLPYVKGLLRYFRWKNQVNKLNFDCIYLPFTWSGNAGRVKAKKLITIHDLRPMKEPDRLFTQTWWFKKLCIKKIYLSCSKWFYTQHIKNAHTVIGISDYMSNQLRDEWSDNRDKIKTIYNCVSLNNESFPPVNSVKLGKYILYVNTLTPYKNIITLIKAFELISTNKIFTDYKLVIVGKPTQYWEKVIQPYITEHNLSDKVIHIHYAKDGELKWLYQSAKLFVTTSLHEGFGYTPIEAAMCGCPVISTRCESLPDVTGEKLNYYMPATDANALHLKIIEVLNTDIKQNDLVAISEFFKHRYDVKMQVTQILETIMI